MSAPSLWRMQVASGVKLCTSVTEVSVVGNATVLHFSPEVTVPKTAKLVA
uniref:Uncharacterized protein n=1 Tax=Arundo donax TaxID=35708 RepID=A0A0A9HAF7_ARUDO